MTKYFGDPRFSLLESARLPVHSSKRAYALGRAHPVRTVILILHLLVSLSAHAVQPAASRSPVNPSNARSPAETGPAQHSALAEENRALKAELAALKENRTSADKAGEELNAELRRLNTELISIRQASANALQIQSERDSLQENVINLERELEVIKRAKLAMEGDHRQAWFLIGAGVLLAGIVLGLLLPQLSWRKRNGWDSF